MLPPTFVSATSTAYNTTGTSKTASITTQAGDVVVIYGGTEDRGTILLTGVSGNSISFTSQQAVEFAGWGGAYIWTGTDSAGGTNWTLTISSDSSSGRWGATCLVFRNSLGIGATTGDHITSGAPSLDITTTQDNSAIAVVSSDWNAQDGASRTWRTVNGITPTAGNGYEKTYSFNSGLYTIYGGYYPDAGTAGAKTVGLSAPGSQKYAIASVEVLGDEIPPEPGVDAVVAWLSQPTTPTLRAAATNSALAATSLDVTIPATTRPGDLLVLTVAQSSFNATLFNAIAGWTKQGEQRAGGAAQTIAVFTRIAQEGDAGGTVTTTSVNAESYTAQVRVYYGIDQLSPMDVAVVFGEQDPAATSASAPAVTAATANTTIVTAYSIPTTTGLTLTDADWATTATGFANEVTSCTNSGSANNSALAIYDKSANAIGSNGPFGATVTDSRRWAMASITIRSSGPLLQDNFDAGTYDPQWANQPGSISGGMLQFTTLSSYAHNIISVYSFNFTGRTITVQVPVVPTAPSGEAWLEVITDGSGNGVMVGKGGDSLVLRAVNGGVLDDIYILYSAVDHAWWRMTYDGTTLQWQASPDATTWTTLRSATSGFPSLSSVTFEMSAGHYIGGDPDEPVAFDNFSVV